jgi:hypothetical protein
VLTPELNIVQQSYLTMTLEASREYVLNCIQETQSLPECNAFKSPQLNWTSKSTLCPFNELCLGPTDGALYMETGLLDSRNDFGINANDKDRVEVRRNATCIPITTEGYNTNGTSRFGPADSLPIDNAEVSGMAFNYTALFYGPTYENITGAGLADPALRNITYIYTNFRDIATEFWNYERSPYDVQ